MMPSTSSTLFGGSSNKGGGGGTSDSKKAKLDPPGRDVAVTLPDGTSVREYEAVQAYLRTCPFAPPNHPAIVAAIDGVEKELAKRKRDALLQAKFLKQESAAGAAGATALTPRSSDGSASQELVHVHKTEMVESSSGGSFQMTASSEEPDDWHQVGEEHGDDDIAAAAAAAGSGGGNAGANASDAPSSSSSPSTSVGAELTREVISSIALFEARVYSPVEMVAVALHSALRGPMLGFACTGVPDATSGGFAPSVRELPPTHFLPKGWNADPASVVLRYRKKGVGSMILRVEHESTLEGFDVSAVSMDRVWIKVSVIPNASSLAEKDAEPSDPSLTFPASEYINLSSFQLALNSSAKPQGGVAPALHFKGLPVLLSRFVQTFDLGGIVRSSSDASAEARTELPYVDTTVRTLPVHAGSSTAPTTFNRAQPNLQYDESQSPTIDTAFPGASMNNNSRGDFSDDLMIGGGNIPALRGIGPPPTSPWMGGNLMGPNHPMFAGVGPGLSGVGPNSGFGMRPRFDPIGGPPGGPTDVDVTDPARPTGRNGVDPATNRPRRNLGDPNPDHLSPPNSFHSNMFM
jgi:hypothetical protein